MIASSRNLSFGAGCLATLALLGGCLTTGQGTPTPGLRSVEIEPECPDPRPTAVVARFDAAVQDLPQEVPAGLADMLLAAMSESGCYRMIDPIALAGSGGGLAAGGADLARRVGADLLVMGKVTEFVPDASGAEVGVADGPKLPEWLGGAGFNVASSRIALALRLVDARTGEVIAAQTLLGSAQDLGGEVSESRLGLSLAAYAKTPMGQAMQAAIDEAVAFLLTRTASRAGAYQQAAAAALR